MNTNSAEYQRINDEVRASLFASCATIQPTTEVSGTCLQGYLEASYSDIVKAFGEPHDIFGDKTQAEWAFVEPATGVVFTIYDYKEVGGAERVTNWHVGGYDDRAVRVAKLALVSAQIGKSVITK